MVYPQLSYYMRVASIILVGLLPLSLLHTENVLDYPILCDRLLLAIRFQASIPAPFVDYTLECVICDMFYENTFINSIIR